MKGSAMPTITAQALITYAPTPPALCLLQYLKQKKLTRMQAASQKSRNANKGVGSAVAAVLHNSRLFLKLIAEMITMPKKSTKPNAELAKSVTT
jgi:hypothetical protein